VCRVENDGGADKKGGRAKGKRSGQVNEERSRKVGRKKR
jgi:hypothetical protein